MARFLRLPGKDIARFINADLIEEAYTPYGEDGSRTMLVFSGTRFTMVNMTLEETLEWLCEAVT